MNMQTDVQVIDVPPRPRMTTADVKDYADLQRYMAERGFRVPNRIPLTRGFFARVDPEDYVRLWNMKWTYLASKSGVGYAVHHFRANGRSRCIMMHRFLLNAPQNMTVDHINGNGLDNRRS